MATSTPAEEETAAAALRRAVAGDRDLVGVAEAISHQALLRMACEVRQATRHNVRFTATGVVRVNVTPDHRLHFVLDGCPDDALTASDAYFARCRDQSAHRGFAFAVVLAKEDHVHSLCIPPLVLPHRLSVFWPERLEDFELACLLMYLENCPRAHATASAFVKISAWLAALGRRTSPFDRVRCLLLRSCQWMLNTLMFMVHVEPFDEQYVLPHWCMARYLLANNPPPILTALFRAAPSRVFRLPVQPKTNLECVAYNSQGVLAAGWASEDFRAGLVSWWSSDAPKTQTSALFYRLM
ncbi:tegument protein UL7 [Macacine alphaherpesvirus 1]|uniref:Tegument protein UL7 n=1 Tax=Cercopithecine herpesvirus 1 TaxID=10325 RepID=A0A059WNV9_CHV1|nr:tegument protein UL7 [Macacine alphaherpesvirus 1]